MALPSSLRLKRRQDFDRIYRQGQRISGQYFLVRSLQASSSPASGTAQTLAAPRAAQRERGIFDLGTAASKVGVVVSLKVSKRAVVRNRIRRQVQAAIAGLIPRFAGDWLLLISARPAAVECDYWQFLQELEKLLTRAKVIHGHSGRGLL